MPNEDTLFLHALDLPPTERSAFLDQACAGDPALRARVERLIAASEGMAGILDAAPADRERLATAEKPGDVIDRYTLVRCVGEGGCGVVWLAQQTAPVRRQVAVKIIKRGMDTAEVIQRFEAERQALALMDHPDIARVFDAGATSTGRPFFVMEFVDGVPITTYCDEHNLDLTQRLQLFVRVCGAIQHAHQKGIIHRDVKPSNVLVARVDEQPAPKVIDFGIAKATEQRLTAATLVTQVGQFLGTPAYMSPEQARWGQADIDTRTDIYSLGVLLYELLTGAPPFDAKQLLAAGLDAMWRQIREVDPPTPSSRLQTLSPELLRTTATKRVEPAPRLIHRIAGDLDWIVMCCMEKARDRRYATAAALAEDIRRHLDDQPVLARPAGWSYRLAKLVRRNRLAVTATVAVALALLGGTIVSTWQAVRAGRAERTALAAEQRARDEAAAALAVADFLADDILLQADVFQQSAIHGESTPDLTVREALLRSVAGIGERFADQPLVEARLRVAIGRALASLELREDAQHQLRRAFELRARALGEHHELTRQVRTQLAILLPREQAAEARELLLSLLAEYDALPELAPEAADTYQLLLMETAVNLSRDGEFDAAEQKARAMIELNERMFGLHDRRTLRGWRTLALVESDRGRYEAAYDILRTLRDRLVAAYGEESADVVVVQNNLVQLLTDLHRNEEAIPLAEQTIAIGQRVLGPDVFVTLSLRGNLGHAHSMLKEYEKAVAVWEALRVDARRVLGEDHPITVTTLNNLAMTYDELNRPADSLPIHLELQEVVARIFGPDHANAAISRHNLGRARMLVGQYDEARADFDWAWNVMRAAVGADHPQTLQLQGSLADNLERQERWAEAVPIRRTVWELYAQARGPDFRQTLDNGRRLARALQRAGETDASRAVWDAMTATLEASAREDAPQRLIDLRIFRAVALAEQGDHAAAEVQLQLVLAAREQTQPDRWTTFDTRARIGGTLLARRQLAEAEPWLISGYEGMVARAGQDTRILPERVEKTRAWLAELYTLWAKPAEAARWSATPE